MNMNMFDLTGKVALVTGGSYGIGFAIACGLANAGAKVVFNDIKQELVDKGLASYAEAGIDAKGYVCDVTDEEAYTICSTIFENTEAITTQHAKGAELDLAYASECGLPYHAGAAKYFAEKGITVAE